jgi:hypothetical protein
MALIDSHSSLEGSARQLSRYLRSVIPNVRAVAKAWEELRIQKTDPDCHRTIISLPSDLEWLLDNLERHLPK